MFSAQDLLPCKALPSSSSVAEPPGMDWGGRHPRTCTGSAGAADAGAFAEDNAGAENADGEYDAGVAAGSAAGKEPAGAALADSGAAGVHRGCDIGPCPFCESWRPSAKAWLGRQHHASLHADCTGGHRRAQTPRCADAKTS